MRLFLVATIFASAGIAPASAKPEFSVYDGPSPIQKGEGGFKTIRDGIEFWADGRPSRGYRVVGFVREKNPCNFGTRFPIDYSSISKMAKAHGFDALLLLDSKLERVDLSQSGEETYDFTDELAKRGIFYCNGTQRTVPCDTKQVGVRGSISIPRKSIPIPVGSAACGENRFLAVKLDDGLRTR